MTSRPSQPLELESETAAERELAAPTIANPALAAALGSAYEDLAAFAIDVDRVYWLDPEDARLPFGWEVFVTEHYLLDWASQQGDRGLAVIEAMCAPLLGERPGEPPLGGQLVFAVYDAVVRGLLPDELRGLFASWRHAPRELLHTLHELRQTEATHARQLATYCLHVALQPPLAASTKHALEHMRSTAVDSVSGSASVR